MIHQLQQSNKYVLPGDSPTSQHQLCSLKQGLSSPVITQSVISSLVLTFTNVISPCVTCFLKELYFTAMCFKQGVIFGEVPRMRAPLLSSNTLK